jgi:hypothetical protein
VTREFVGVFVHVFIFASNYHIFFTITLNQITVAFDPADLTTETISVTTPAKEQPGILLLIKCPGFHISLIRWHQYGITKPYQPQLRLTGIGVFRFTTEDDGSFASNTVGGTPAASGTFSTSYSIGWRLWNTNATGTITVTSKNTVTLLRNRHTDHLH